MPEKSEAAQAFITHLICKCGGVMVYTGKEVGQPVRFQYECPQCKLRELSPTRYPYITYRPLEKSPKVKKQ